MVSDLERGPTFHPGEALREDYLPDLGWTPEELARRLRVPVETVLEVLAERRPVTPELAMRLARLFNQSASFWLKIQISHDLRQLKQSPMARDVAKIEPLNSEPIRRAG